MQYFSRDLFNALQRKRKNKKKKTEKKNYNQ